ncbi:sugar phosphate isomerase/epimerase family protein [Litoribaculum gwangyangense]|uniref:TIM barrel protein n=1 Tax=Litoribaculum gwangyangense TaxID=1130722 RepID=A0ABP9CPF9_9FLAO
MKYSKILMFIFFFIIINSCSEKTKRPTIKIEDIYAWCIVPFDSVNRNPEERINMLKKLDLTKYAYDWREEDLENMATELRLANKNKIDIIAIWMWIDNQRDSIGKLNKSNKKVFDIIKEVGYKGEIWVSFHANFFENLTDSLSIQKGAKMIDFISNQAEKMDCKIGLYNHGDWFGEPENQIKIIKALPNRNLGIVYNFHHAQNHIDTFSEIVEIMLPYLWHVNLNGMKRNGPKILPIGKGDQEMEMITSLKEKGYKGDYGILGHVENADVELILRANLNGLKN